MTDDKPNPVNMFEEAHAREIEIIKLKHKNRMELANHISEAEVSEEARELMKLNNMLTYRDAVLEIGSVMAAYRKAMAGESEELEEQKVKEWQKEWRECMRDWQAQQPPKKI